MTASSAFRLAMALFRAPTLAGAMRQMPLPPNVLSLIKVAAGDQATIASAAQETGASADNVREAAVLFLQSVLLAPNGSHYRVLAVEPDAPQAQLRLHMAWLVKWLHPDRAGSQSESIFVNRVLSAWDAVKTPDRRETYDQMLRVSERLAALHARRLPALHHRTRPAAGWPKRKIVVLGAGLILATFTWIASRSIVSEEDSKSTLYLESTDPGSASARVEQVEPRSGTATGDGLSQLRREE